jgi:hypothetical protein
MLFPGPCVVRKKKKSESRVRKEEKEENERGTAEMVYHV